MLTLFHHKLNSTYPHDFEIITQGVYDIIQTKIPHSYGIQLYNKSFIASKLVVGTALQLIITLRNIKSATVITLRNINSADETYS